MIHFFVFGFASFCRYDDKSFRTRPSSFSCPEAGISKQVKII
jgi:rubredoxin